MEHFQNISDYRRFYELLTKRFRLEGFRQSEKRSGSGEKKCGNLISGQGEKNYKGLEGKLWKAVVGNGNQTTVGNQGDNGAVVTTWQENFLNGFRRPRKSGIW